MPRFFKSMSAPATVGDVVSVDGQDAVHLRRSLRLSVGDEVLLCDGRSTEYDTVIVAFGDNTVELAVHNVRHSEAEPTLKLTLFQGLPKGDKLELIVQKAVELGVTTVVPVEMTRSIAKISDKAAKKQARLQTIASEAAGQSGRGIIPTVEAPVSFDKILPRVAAMPTVVCYENGGEPFTSLIAEGQTELGIVIGPEGGISPDEIGKLLGCGAKVATLGKRILRCETAPLAAIAVAMAVSGNMT